ncbi:hypothetical protein Tco_0187527, partial [Tanacetum coccineum]
VQERITKTKRSKNDQKPTRNERDKNKNEETVRDQSRIIPTQQERKTKTQDKVKRTKNDKYSKIQGLIWKFEVLEIKGPKLTKEESVLLKKKERKKTTRAKPVTLKLPFTLKGAEQKKGTNCANIP